MTSLTSLHDLVCRHDGADEDAAGPILAAFDLIGAADGDPRQVAAQQFQFIMTQIRTNARPFFKELRDDCPICVTAPATLVARFRDVEEILHREDVFSVRPYLPRMNGVIGPFVLSQDVTPLYDHDISAMRLVVRREDVGRVRGIVAYQASEIVDRLVRQRGPFDIVQTLTRVVPVRLADVYLGFAAADDRQMMTWARACFREFFINLTDDPAIRAPAVAAGAAMMARLDAVIAARRAAADDRDDVLARLLRQQCGGALGFDDAGVERTLAGLVIGMVETTSQAVVHALLVLFSMPDALAAAKADDDDGLGAIVFEALRFRPINPFIVRWLADDYVLGAGEPHARRLAKGTVVFALSWSAMFDERVVDDPKVFRPGRPLHHDLNFSTGRHACFGRYISRVQIPQILKALLRHDGLRPAGEPAFDGTFPDRFMVAVDG